MQHVERNFSLSIPLIFTDRSRYLSLHVEGLYKGHMQAGEWQEEILIQEQRSDDDKLLQQFIAEEWLGDAAGFRNWIFGEISEHCTPPPMDNDEYDDWAYRTLF